MKVRRKGFQEEAEREKRRKEDSKPSGKRMELSRKSKGCEKRNCRL